MHTLGKASKYGWSLYPVVRIEYKNRIRYVVMGVAGLKF